MSRAAIVAAGRRLAASEGVGVLSMRRLAAEVGCSPMALYRHVADKRELLVLLLEDVAAGLDVSVPEGEPAEQLCALFDGLHAYLSGFPWVVEVLRQGEVFAPRAMVFVESVLGALARAGVRNSDAVTAYTALWHYTVGHLASAHPTNPAIRAGRDELVHRAPLDDLPLLREVLPVLGAVDTERVFRDGLRAVVRGLLAGA